MMNHRIWSLLTLGLLLSILFMVTVGCDREINTGTTSSTIEGDDTNTATVSDSDLNVDSATQTNMDTHSDFDKDTHSEFDKDTHSDFDTDTNSDTSVDSISGGDTNTNSDSNSSGDTETSGATDTDGDTATSVDSDGDTDTSTDSNSASLYKETFVKINPGLDGYLNNASISGNGEKIIFSTTQWQQQTLYTVNADGTGMIPIFEDRTIVSTDAGNGSIYYYLMAGPAFVSSNGKKVVFSMAEALPGAGYAWWDVKWLGVVNTDGTDFTAIPFTTGPLEAIYTGPTSGYSINGDGTLISVTTCYALEGEDCRSLPHQQIITMNSDGTEQSVLFAGDTGGALFPYGSINWITDRGIFYKAPAIGDDNSSHNIYLLPTAGTSPLKQTPVDGDYDTYSILNASDDGNYFSWDDNGKTSLMNVATGTFEVITFAVGTGIPMSEHHATVGLCPDGQAVIKPVGLGQWLFKNIGLQYEQVFATEISDGGSVYTIFPTILNSDGRHSCGVLNGGSYRILLQLNTEAETTEFFAVTLTN